MKRHYFTAACCAALMLALTGCGTEQNLSVQYGDFFKYCFGDGYTFTDQGEVPESGNVKAHRSFKLTYTDVNGNQRVNDQVATYDYPKEEKESYPTEQDFYNAEVADIAFREINNIAKDAFYADYLSQFFDCETRESGSGKLQLEIKGGEGEVANTFYLPVFLPNEKQPDKSIALGFIEPGSGLQACTADLKSVAQDDRWVMTCSMTIQASADTEQYLQSMQQMIEKYKADMVSPQNYVFILKQRQTDDETDLSTNVLLQEYTFFGESIDLAAKREEIEGYSPAKAVYDMIIQKYGAAG